MKMIIVLSGIIMLFSITAMAQKVVENTPIPISNKVPVIENKPEKLTMHPQSKAEKVLYAGVKKITFSCWGTQAKGDMGMMMGGNGFRTKSIELRGNNANKFHLIGSRDNTRTSDNSMSTKNTFALSYIIASSKGDKNANYKAFLDNGFTIKINFSGRDGYIEGLEFAANYSLTFDFTDGTSVLVPLQEEKSFTGKKGVWITTGDVNITKSFSGSVFPDPAAKPAQLKTHR